MQRYAKALNALNTAMNLMIEEGDTLLIASISHPLHMAESQLMLRRAEKLAAKIARPPTSENGSANARSQ